MYHYRYAENLNPGDLIIYDGQKYYVEDEYRGSMTYESGEEDPVRYLVVDADSHEPSEITFNSTEIIRIV